MRYTDKQVLFDNYLIEWELQFKKVPSILRYIISYPEIASKFDDLHPLSLESLNISQLEWVSLVKQFDNPIETIFFKEYWVPIQRDGYDYFIDLSSEKFSIFETKYFFFEPYCWYKQFIAEDLSDFLTKIDSQYFDAENFFEKMKMDRLFESYRIYKERRGNRNPNSE
jgi:hypothetical protein